MTERMYVLTFHGTSDECVTMDGMDIVMCVSPYLDEIMDAMNSMMENDERTQEYERTDNGDYYYTNYGVYRIITYCVWHQS